MITAIILTKNEQVHLERCLLSLMKINAHVKIVDSGSSDTTLDIAAKFPNVDIFHRAWVNYADQFNWAILNCDIKTKWTLRIDADEYLDDELIIYINNKLNLLPPAVTGIEVERGNFFLNKEIKRGSGKVYHLKIWKSGAAYCEEKWMDEHMIVTSGIVVRAEGKLVDHNLHSISNFISKHNSYSTREAIDFFEQYIAESNSNPVKINKKAPTYNVKKLYYKFPIFIRPVIFYIHAMLFRGGIFDGAEGFVYHTIQKLFYRFLVDVKIYEALKKRKNENVDPIIYLKNNISA